MKHLPGISEAAYATIKVMLKISSQKRALAS